MTAPPPGVLEGEWDTVLLTSWTRGPPTVASVRRIGAGVGEKPCTAGLGAVLARGPVGEAGRVVAGAAAVGALGALLGMLTRDGRPPQGRNLPA